MGLKPSLTHVCMWNNNNWTPITPKQAIAKIGNSKVSSDLQLFICDLCGQYVTLASGKVQEAHFRHSKKEADKSCKERSFSNASSGYYDPKEHTLPLRLTKHPESSNYYFQLGLVRVPFEDFDDDFRLEIEPYSRTYDRTDIFINSITYLDVGYIPYETYTIKFKNAPAGLREFWPLSTPGVAPSGTLFDKQSGIKINNDADVVLNREYLLLTKESVPIRSNSSVEIKQLEHATQRMRDWYMYEVRALKFDQFAAKFFIQYHCRLTEKPAALQPIWPLYSEGSFMIRHSSDHIYILRSGNTYTLKSFPATHIQQLNTDNRELALYQVNCTDRQQLISTGRSNVLQYTYLWKEPLVRQHRSLKPKLLVTDINGQEILAGESFSLPDKGCLKISAEFDGYIIIKHNGFVEKKVTFEASTPITIFDIRLNSAVDVFIGHDLIWRHDFKIQPKECVLHEPSQHPTLNDEQFYRRLILQYGDIIKPPHAIRNIQSVFKPYQKVYQWISNCIETGSINVRAYHLLEHTYRQLKAQGRGDH